MRKTSGKDIRRIRRSSRWCGGPDRDQPASFAGWRVTDGIGHHHRYREHGPVPALSEQIPRSLLPSSNRACAVPRQLSTRRPGFDG